MEVIWKPIPLFEGGYWASNDGQIRSANKILYQGVSSSGYHVVYIKNKSWRAHRLVALAFGIISGAEIVNHIDGVKTNNNISNLEKSSDLENIRHAFKMGLNKLPDWNGERNTHAKLRKEDVLYIREHCQPGGQSYEFAKRYGVHVTTIQRILSKKRWRHL